MKASDFFAGGAKRLAWMAGGVALATAVAVTAQQAGTSSSTSSSKDCALSGAVNDAVNQKVKLLGMVSTDPAKYFSVDAAESCLGPIARLNSDISDGIPDPLGYLKDKALQAMQAVGNAAYAKACTASRGALGDYITRYNSAIQTTNGAGQTIDSKIGQDVKKGMNDFGLDYNAAPIPTSVKNAAQGAASAVSSAATSGATSTGSSTNSSSLATMIFH